MYRAYLRSYENYKVGDLVYTGFHEREHCIPRRIVAFEEDKSYRGGYKIRLETVGEEGTPIDSWIAISWITPQIIKCRTCRYWKSEDELRGFCTLIGVGTFLNRHVGCPLAGIGGGSVSYLQTGAEFGCVHWAPPEPEVGNNKEANRPQQLEAVQV